MGPTYAVSWRNLEGATDSGRLELGPRALRLKGAEALEIAYGDVTNVAVGRGTGDRLKGRTALVVSCTNGRPVWITPVADHASLLELHDRLSALTGEPASTQ